MSAGGISFGDYIAEETGIVPPSQDARRVGQEIAQYIPQPSIENGGFREAARWWAYYVGNVFPLTSAVPDPGQPHAGKTPHPILRSGWGADDIGTRNLSDIEDLWREAPLANVGITTRASEILILDIDPRHGGWQSMGALAAECGIDIASVPRSSSPRGDGGAHLWFRVPPEVVARCSELDDLGGQQDFYPHSPIAPGVDRPWQVPVPPSVRYVTKDPTSKDAGQHYEFRAYAWEAGDPRSLPLAPERLLGEGVSQSASVRASADGSAAPGGIEAVDLTSVSGRISPDTVTALVQEGVPVGKQSFVFKRMACSMVRRKYSDTQIIETLVETAARSPIGDASNPWTRSDLETMTQHARRYIASEDRRERAEAARYGAIARQMFFGGRT